MESSRNNRSRRNRPDRDSLDRRVDQWIETGKQFVDGVAGTRPGTRRFNNYERRSSPNLESVGKWVGNKIDWLFEDEDDWQEPWQEDNQLTRYQGKRPLEAISLRMSNSTLENTDYSDISLSNEKFVHEEWPDDSSYKIDRWQREKSKPNFKRTNSNRINESNSYIDKRTLPRSSRNR